MPPAHATPLSRRGAGKFGMVSMGHVQDPFGKGSWCGGAAIGCVDLAVKVWEWWFTTVYMTVSVKWGM